MSEMIFDVTEDEEDDGNSSSALGYCIHTQGDSLDEIRRNIKDAVDCYFDDTIPRPSLLDPSALRARRASRGMKLSRNVCRVELQPTLRRVGYETVR